MPIQPNPTHETSSEPSLRFFIVNFSKPCTKGGLLKIVCAGQGLDTTAGFDGAKTVLRERLHAHSTVDGEHLTRDVGGLRTREKHDDGGDILRGPKSRQRDLR